MREDTSTKTIIGNGGTSCIGQVPWGVEGDSGLGLNLFGGL